MGMSRLPSWVLSALAGAALSAASLSAQTPRVANLSTRGQVGTGANVMIAGFVVGPGSGQTVLIRAVGPALTSYGVGGALARPQLTLSDSSGVIATNTGWSATPVAGPYASHATVRAATTSVFNQVSAFSLSSGSADCAMVATLPANGTYVAQVSGVGATSGTALVEVYEVGPTDATSRLVNLSTRLQIGSGSSIATTGFVISPGSGARTLLIRAVGPTLGTTYGVPGALSDPSLVLLNSAGAAVAANDNWGTPVGTNATSPAALSAAFAQAYAFPLPAASADSALIAVVSPGSYSIQVSGVGTATGVALVEVYDITPSGTSAPTVSIAATTASANTAGTSGAFTVSRTGDTSYPLTVSYTVAGTAVAGRDYAALTGSITVPAGSASAAIAVAPGTTLSAASATVVVTLSPGAGYATGAARATVTIANLAPTLYVTNLVPASGAAGTTGSGTATIALASDGSSAVINVSFSGLSSAEQVPHLTVGPPGSSSNFVLTLDYPGQVVEQSWSFTAVGTYSTADLVSALKSGNVFVEIGSLNYPTGELTGQFVQQSGSQTFSAPAAPPAIDLSKPTQADAARFLTQATFGPTRADIATVTAQGYPAWIASQMALTPTSHLAATRADAAAFPNTGTYAIVQANRQQAWWKAAVTAPDQLRQRVAFALSEILVVSDAASSLAQQPEALANYYDMLAADAFGNFRQLIEDVTLSPVMGNYLNMLRNAPANAAKGTSADENYARELMQLFTIGLNQLNPDGSLKLDQTGQPIATYTNATIIQTANVLTGWSYHSTLASPSFTGGTADWYNPMQVFPSFHDNTLKTIVGGVTVPANEGGAADLKILLDTLANHPNTGPFISRELIQRLVTSNPSSGYIYRVSQVFANDGTGTRGNLAAVVRAILLDYEARSSAVISDAGYGRLKEPLLRQTALYRAFNASAQNGRYYIPNPETSLGQAALRSPTVFNFFLPAYVPPGSMAEAGLSAPEFQITTATTAITVPNAYYNAIYTSATPAAATLVLDLSALTSASNNAAMVANLNLLLCGGNLSTAASQRILSALTSLPSSAQALDRARAALELVVTSPDGAIQR